MSNFNGTADNSLLKRAFMFLEDEDWEEADKYCERVLDEDPEKAQAYLGKLMAELHVSMRDELKNYDTPFDDKNNYKKAIRFADDALKAELTEYNNSIKYNMAKQEMEKACTEMEIACTQDDFQSAALDFYSAAKVFHDIVNFKDSASLEALCKAKAEDAQKKQKNLHRAVIDRALSLAETIVKLDESQKTAQEIQELNAKLKCAEENAAIINALREEEASLQAQKTAVERSLNELRDARAKLGLFDIKGKKTTDAKIAESEEEIKTLTSKIDGCQKELNKYASIEQIDAQIKELKKTISEKEAACAKSKNSGSEALTLEEATRRIVRLCSPSEFKNEVGGRNKKLLHNEILKRVFAEEGDIIKFGAYPNVKKSEKTPIEWLVLVRAGSSLLVISRYVLDVKRYNEVNEDITWEKCTLRRWLNNDFYNTAFSENEKKAIELNDSLDHNPIYDTDTGKITEDHVFLLGCMEAKDYFDSDTARQCKPTEFAIVSGAYDGSDCECKDFLWWWLRSPGSHQNYAAIVNSNGSVLHRGLNVSSDGWVRPALWINLDS